VNELSPWHPAARRSAITIAVIAWSPVNSRAAWYEAIHTPSPLAAGCRLNRALAKTSSSIVRVYGFVGDFDHWKSLCLKEGHGSHEREPSCSDSARFTAARSERLRWWGRSVRLRQTAPDYYELHGMQKVRGVRIPLGPQFFEDQFDKKR
jgi:hypothetical protein